MLDEETCMVSFIYLIPCTGFEPLLIEDDCQKCTEFMGHSGFILGYFVLRSESGAQQGERGQSRRLCS